MLYFLCYCSCATLVMLVGVGCSGAGSKVNVVAESTSVEKKEESSQETINKLIKRDAKKAREILRDAVAGQDELIAGYGAVYSRFLGIEYDRDAVARALINGLNSDDTLLAALCWRWLAETEDDLPLTKSDTEQRPVVKLFKHIALLKSKQASLKSSHALHCGIASTLKSAPSYLDALPFLMGSLDNGPLADAIMFVHKRYRELAFEKSDGKRYPSSALHRGKLLRHFDLSLEGVTIEKKQGQYQDTKLIREVQSPIWRHPLKLLRRLCVHSDGSLQFEAVRSLGARAVKPAAGDLAAAAAVMESEDAYVRVEAAKTYLLLVARSVLK